MPCIFLRVFHIPSAAWENVTWLLITLGILFFVSELVKNISTSFCDILELCKAKNRRLLPLSCCGLWCNHPNAFAMHLGYCAVQLENQWFSAWTVLWNSNGRTLVSCWLKIAEIVSLRGILNLSFLKQNRCFAYLKVNE